MNIFHEAFDTETNGLPGGWRVECNSNLAEVPAICLGENCLDLLSAGNKFLPIIPEVQDFHVKTRLSFNYACAECGGEGTFGVTLAFRYDAKYRRGQSLRLRQLEPGHFVFQYGYVRRNVFTAQQEIPFEMDDALLNQPFDLEIAAKGTQLSATAFGFTANFSVQEGRGALAFSRMHFFDVLKILEWDVFTDDQLQALSEKSFTIPMPDEPTYYPIFCDVKLQDFGNCYEADLTFSGGVKYTPHGEGNYRSLRTDLLTRPYLAVIEKDSFTRHTLFRRCIVLVPEGLPNNFFYGVLNEKVEWPFHRRVRFAKPEADFDLALGFEKYVHAQNAELAQSPSETIFDAEGRVLYSGRGIIDASPKVDFLSQPEKEFAKFLPKDDPRHQEALDFLKYNHFFMEGEVPCFVIKVIGKDAVGCNFELTLEDVLLRTLRTLSFKAHSESIEVGVRTVPVQSLEVEPLEGLQCGVWHLRLRTKDCYCDVEDYCAFEIMSKQENALPAPLLSGLPWLYNSRTETRGLVTDGFDPWKGKSVNATHYLAAANFLPPAARKYNVIPTVHAYQRQYFLWLGTRCLDKPLMADNMDLLNQADYVYMSDELNQMSLLWLRTYRTFVLEKLIKFGKTLNDADFPLQKLQEELDKGEHIDLDSFRYLALNHWSAWLDYINEARALQKRNLLKKLRQENPKLYFAQYGPAHIYAGCLKGPEFIRLLQNAKSTNDIDGYWQYEDYPYSCNYGLEKGSYFLASALLALPGSRIYPEIYMGGGRGGCGDGAVYYGYPPFGQRPISYPEQMSHYVFEFCYATAHKDAKGMHYWEKCGFQACGFSRRWNEALLKAWRLPAEHKPEAPVWNVAFVSSANSLRAAQMETQFLVEYPQYGIVDVRNTASEVVPYLAQTARKKGLPPGFQIFEECLQTLTAKDVSLLVLPPLKGMAQDSLDKIRQLHSEGVSLIACEDVSGLEDLFGVRNTGKRRNPTLLHGTDAFMPGEEEICDDERCAGRYEAVDAKVLISAEIPVLTLKRNASASAAFFNVAPNLVREDALIERMTYSKEGISEFMAKAVALLMCQLAPAPVKSDCGRIVACRTCKDEILLMAYNHSGKHDIDMEISLDPAILATRTVQCSQPYSRIGNERLRIKLPIFGSATFLFS